MSPGAAAEFERLASVKPAMPTTAGKFAINVAQETEVPDDPMFERMVESALADPGPDQRFAAAFVLRSSPWCAQLAHTCVERVRQYAAGRNAAEREQLHRTMVLLSIIGTDAERRPLARLVESGPENLRPLALFALAHLPPADGSPLLLGPLLVGDDESLARAALYCAGMTADPALADIEEDETVADWRRRAARWWREYGPAIHEPAPG
jgi:HEAT repeat protein